MYKTENKIELRKTTKVYEYFIYDPVLCKLYTL